MFLGFAQRHGGGDARSPAGRAGNREGAAGVVDAFAQVAQPAAAGGPGRIEAGAVVAQLGAVRSGSPSLPRRCSARERAWRHWPAIPSPARASRVGPGPAPLANCRRTAVPLCTPIRRQHKSARSIRPGTRPGCRRCRNAGCWSTPVPACRARGSALHRPAWRVARPRPGRAGGPPPVRAQCRSGWAPKSSWRSRAMRVRSSARACWCSTLSRRPCQRRR